MPHVRSVSAGKMFLSRRLAGSAVEQYLRERHTESPLESLSTRERQVLQLIVDGKTSSEVAVMLTLSPKSVDTYRSRVMRKLGVSEEALKEAVEAAGPTVGAVRRHLMERTNPRA